MAVVQKVLTKVFGSRNDRLLKRYRRIVDQINEFEPKVQKLSDAASRARTQELRRDITAEKTRIGDVLPEALAIIRESMDRHIGIRNIFNPDEHFDPDKLDDKLLQVYDGVQKHMIATGESWQTVAIPTELYAAVRTLYPESRPPFRARCFDVQLIGGLVLYEGKIAEMATGEGKTFVAPLACFLKTLESWHVHVVTVNDYLVRRDSQWVKPAFDNLGITVGYIQADMDPGGDGRRLQYDCDVTYGTNSEFGFDYLRDNMKERVESQVQGPLDFAIVDEVDSILIDEARTPLIISGAAHDDAPKYRAADAVARVVIEKHKPYAAAEKAVESAKRSIKAAQGDEDKAKDKEGREGARKREEEATEALAKAEENLKKYTQYYEVELDRKSVHLTHEGIASAQDSAGVGSFYVGNNMEWPHLMEQALRAHVVYERDKDYVVEKGTGPRSTGEMEVVIVDEYTGRKMVGRQWSDGLHQAVEAKERVPIKQETQTLATITLQNFFKLYRQLGGMTGTAMTESEEFTNIYELEVVAIPTNRPVVRADQDDRVYRTEEEKWEQVIEEIKTHSDAGRPVLVGTTSVEKSEKLSGMLMRKYGVQHEVLNAKQHEREAHIVVVAGQQHKNQHGETVGNVTIATNMAGRGTDIKLSPEAQFDVVVEPATSKDGKKSNRYTLTQRGSGKKIEVGPDDPLIFVYGLTPTTKVVGGLHVIGTERHTARRIDNQLRGRGGRQGDPGSSRFYVSLQDDLLKMFMADWAVNVFKKIGMEYGEAIESGMLSRGIMKAQKKVEERNFLARKNLLEYDEVMDRQRSIFYGMRQQVLEGRSVDKIIWDMIGDSIEDAVDKYVTQDFVAATIAEWARMNFSVTIDPEDIRGMRRFEDLEDYIRNQARADIESSIGTTLAEYMGEDPEDASQWDTKGLQSWAMSAFQVNLSQSQMKKMTAFEVEEVLKQAALDHVDHRDASGMLKYLELNYALGELVTWAKLKFDVEIQVSEMLADAGRGMPRPAEDIVDLIEQRARAAYAPRESEFPADTAVSFAFGPEATSPDNPYGAEAIRNWLKAKYSVEVTAEHIRSLSLRDLRAELVSYQQNAIREENIERIVDDLMKAGAAPADLVRAYNARFGGGLSEKDFKPRVAKRRPGQAEVEEEVPEQIDVRAMLVGKVRSFFRRELTDLEQFVLIQIFDQSWKDHLYAMDMLKSSIGLQAFAEKDPRIQYKKEGFRYFDEMMAGIRDKVTDLIFRARIAGQSPQRRSAYQVTEARHDATQNYGVSENVAETAAAGVPTGGSEMQEAASQTQGDVPKVRQIVNQQPKVGRNDPCPCGSGKKYKKCHGVNAA